MLDPMPRKKAPISAARSKALVPLETVRLPTVVPRGQRTLQFGEKWAYAPAPETAAVKIAPRYELFIGGKFVAPRSGKYFPSLNPANEKQLAEIAIGNAGDISAAVAAARSAFPKWSKLPGRERGKYL